MVVQMGMSGMLLIPKGQVVGLLIFMSFVFARKRNQTKNRPVIQKLFYH